MIPAGIKKVVPVDRIERGDGRFEGHDVAFYVFRDRVCIIAAALGRALGYGNDGKKLSDVIRQEWSKEILAGHDYAVLTGADLREFKAQLGDTQEKWVSSSARLMVLYETGVDAVCIKTEKLGALTRETKRGGLGWSRSHAERAVAQLGDRVESEPIGELLREIVKRGPAS